MHRANRVKVEQVFAIREDQWLLANLASFEWDFASFGPVYLCFGSEKIKMRYVANGNVKGNAVVALTLLDPEYRTVEEVMRIVRENNLDLYLERITE